MEADATSDADRLSSVDDAWPSPVDPAQGGAGRRVLLVETDDLLRVLFGVVLAEAGYDVLSFADGQAALAEMARAAKPIDAVVTEIDLSESPDGWVVALSARRLWSSCPVIYLTRPATAARSRLSVAGAIFLSKPFDVSRLAEALTTLFPDAAKS
jgi:DNA-binding response OmpR family regulator